MANIHPIYFSLYAARKRAGLAHNGYPSQVPWYSPPKAGSVFNESSEPVTEDDWYIAEAIEKAVNTIRQRDKRSRELAEMLDIYEGAFLAAPPGRADRCKLMGVGVEACRAKARRCKKEVERLMYG